MVFFFKSVTSDSMDISFDTSDFMVLWKSLNFQRIPLLSTKIGQRSDTELSTTCQLRISEGVGWVNPGVWDCSIRFGDILRPYFSPIPRTTAERFAWQSDRLYPPISLYIKSWGGSRGIPDCDSRSLDIALSHIEPSIYKSVHDGINAINRSWVSVLDRLKLSLRDTRVCLTLTV